MAPSRESVTTVASAGSPWAPAAHFASAAACVATSSGETHERSSTASASVCPASAADTSSAAQNVRSTSMPAALRARLAEASAPGRVSVATRSGFLSRAASARWRACARTASHASASWPPQPAKPQRVRRSPGARSSAWEAASTTTLPAPLKTQASAGESCRTERNHPPAARSAAA